MKSMILSPHKEDYLNDRNIIYEMFPHYQGKYLKNIPEISYNTTDHIYWQTWKSSKLSFLFLYSRILFYNIFLKMIVHLLSGEKIINIFKGGTFFITLLPITSIFFGPNSPAVFVVEKLNLNFIKPKHTASIKFTTENHKLC